MTAFLPAGLILIFGAAFLAPWLHRCCRFPVCWLLSAAPFGAFALLLMGGASVAEGHPLVYQAEWFSRFGVSFGLKLDGLSLLMGLLVTGIGGFIVIYSGGYLKGHPQLGRFYLYLLLFMGAMVGLVLSDDMVLLFIFWELTSITSYLLIGFNHEEKVSRWNALQALLVTGLGAMGMLAGFILIADITGSYSITEIAGQSEVLREHGWYTAIVILILFGAFTKSAQVPFHFWLPNAMAAPTPVSAYLHSATMVKAGVFLIARMTPSLGDSPLWNNSLMCFGAATLLLAVGLGLFHRDLKAILAYTTLAVLGLLTMLLGVGSEYAFKAMVGFLFAHALYKAALFMTAGSVDHETGTREVTALRGLRGKMPITAAAAGLAALSMCGLPPFFGFIGKELVYKTGVGLDGFLAGVLVAAFVGNFLMFALALNAGVAPFWGRSTADELPKKPHEAPISMWLGPLTLGVLGLLFGIVPGPVGDWLVAPAVAAISGADPVEHLHLSLWHGVNLPLILSLFTVICGLILYRFREALWARGAATLAAIRPYGAEAGYERLFEGTVALSKWQTRRLQTGRLHDYMFMIVLTAVILLIWAFVQYGGLRFSIAWSEFNPLMLGLVTIMIVSTVVAVTATRYITVLVSLGTVGMGVALIFVYYGAPDLAITQLLVETLTVILFMFVLFHLPPLKSMSSAATHFRDFLLAGTFGVLVTALVLMALDIQFGEPISDAHAAMSYPEAKGKNVVNVILVDFRALDTMGEITVIATAALGIAALMSSKLKKGKEAGQ